MKRISVLVMLVLAVALFLPGISYSATATTVNNISGMRPMSGYVIRAATITASAPVPPRSTREQAHVPLLVSLWRVARVQGRMTERVRTG